MAITTPDVSTRICKRCGETRPIEQFPVNNRSGRLGYCNMCRQERRREEYARDKARGVSSSTDRQKLADQRRSLGWTHVDTAPASPELPILRDLLAEDRRAGLRFDEVWPEDLRMALTVLPERDRELAAEVLRWARPYFEAGWRREDVCRLDPGLVAAVAA